MRATQCGKMLPSCCPLACCALPAAGAVVKDYGSVDLKEVERGLFDPSQSVSAWFAPEIKLGSLAGSMEAPQCFGAEIYAQVRLEWGGVGLG